ncbi:MAG: hypothetical protein JSS87_13955 [Acidobacteria bacterium]|nr:hypothetical protein [Acidobacteriota bacterium]
MTRQDLLKLLIAHARTNGFKFKPWFVQHSGRPWVTAEDAVTWLGVGRRSYMLLFSPEFAQSFWKSGEQITFAVPQQEFQRVLPNGKVLTVKRKAFTRRTSRPDVWKYHLREMAASEEPLRYLRKYLHIEEALEEEAPHETREA